MVIGSLLLVGVVIYLLLYAGGQSKEEGSCTSNSDCLNDTVCIEGSCTAKTICTGDTDCPNGSCIGGRCTNDSCRNNNQCPVGSLCQVGQCIVSTCNSTIDCPNSSYCINGRCQGNSCVNGSQCTPGYGCDGNICYSTEKTCVNNTDCFGGALPCNEGLCWGNIISDQFCPTGWIYSQGFCFPITNDILCPSGNIAVGGVCCPDEEPCNASCDSNNDCGGNCPFCLDGRCRCQKAEAIEYYPVYPFATCTDDDSCKTNRCLNNFCVPLSYACVNNNQCSGFNARFCIAGQCPIGGSAEGSYCLSDLDIATCRGTGRSCVNSICQIQRGTLGEICLNSADCISGLNCSGNGMKTCKTD